MVREKVMGITSLLGALHFRVKAQFEFHGMRLAPSFT